MQKLEKLTPEQEQLMHQVRNFWLNRIFSCTNRINKEEATKSINWLYKFCGLEEPEIVFVDSPMACQITVNLLKNNVSSLDELKDKKLEFVPFASYGNISDYGWVANYDFYTQIDIINDENFNNFMKLSLSNIYDMIQLEGVCIVSSLPTKIVRNAENILSNLEDVAIEFADGYSQHYVNGVFITPELFDKLLKDRYTLNDFISENNEEIKAACLFYIREKWGEDRLLSFFGDSLKEVNTFVDKKSEEYLQGTSKGMNVGVYTLFKGNLNGIELSYVRCYCPSSDRMFYLGVDNSQTNAKDAIASLYRVPKCLVKHIKEIRRQGERFSTIFTEKGQEIMYKMSKEDAENLVAISGDEYFSKMTYEY